MQETKKRGPMSRILSLPRTTTPGEFLETIIPEELAGVEIPADTTPDKVLFHIEGAGGGTWAAGALDGNLSIAQGSSDTALIQVSISSDDARELLFGSVRDRTIDALGGQDRVSDQLSPGLYRFLFLSTTEAATLREQVSGDLQIVIDDPDEFLEYTLTITFGSDAPQLASPRTTLRVAVDDWVQMAAGGVNPQQAFMQGKIRMEGDMALPMTLMTLATNR